MKIFRNIFGKPLLVFLGNLRSCVSNDVELVIYGKFPIYWHSFPVDKSHIDEFSGKFLTNIDSFSQLVEDLWQRSQILNLRKIFFPVDSSYIWRFSGKFLENISQFFSTIWRIMAKIARKSLYMENFLYNSIYFGSTRAILNMSGKFVVNIIFLGYLKICGNNNLNFLLEENFRSEQNFWVH